MIKELLFFASIILRRIIYGFLRLINIFLSENTNKIVILCYHAINEGTWRFGIRFDELKKQIFYLREQGYVFIAASELLNYLKKKQSFQKPVCLITFDDGYQDVLQTQEYFKKEGIYPTMFVLSQPEMANQKELKTNAVFLSDNEIRSLYAAGWGIGCHSATHADFSRLTEEEREREIVASKHNLEQKLGFPIEYFAYPKGVYSQTICDTIKRAGYKLAFSMDDGFITSQSNPHTLFRVGVDRTHTFFEFQTIFLPAAVLFRRAVKEGMKFLNVQR